jgi:hypothetical protein
MKSVQIIKTILRDSERKPLVQMASESMKLLIADKAIPYHYFSRYLYRKHVTGYKDFLSTPDLMLLYSDKFHNKTSVAIMDNKIVFAEFCEKYGLPAPKMLGYNFGPFFSQNGVVKKLKNPEEIEAFFQEIFIRHNLNSIILKKSSSFGGGSIFKIDEESIKEDVEKISPYLMANDFVFQKIIKNHPSISEIYPHSLNTVRIDMTLNENGEPIVLGTVMRFGAQGNFVDNRSQGGFCVSMDSKKGELLKFGFGQMNKGGFKYFKHPDTGYVFEGFKVPYFNEVIELASELTKRLPTFFVGWDIAISPEGPVVVEGNYKTNLTMSEVAYSGYRKHPEIKRLLNSAKSNF